MKFTVPFIHFTRTIDPKTGIHYLDALDKDGHYWTAHMIQYEQGDWLIFGPHGNWRKSTTQPKIDNRTTEDQ